MKKISFNLLLLLVTAMQSFSQLGHHFASDGFAPFTNNPAATGSINTFSVNGIFRNQLPSLSLVFETYSLSIEADTKFGPKSSRQKFNIPIGLNIISFQNKSKNTQSINIPIAIPIELKNSTLVAGFSMGVKRIKYDWEQIDNQIEFDFEDGAGLDINAGLFWYGDRYYLGGSMTNLSTPNIGGVRVVRYFNMQAGYTFKVGQATIFTMLNGTSDLIANSTVRIMTYLQPENKIFALGLGVSIRDSYVLAASVNLKKFKLTYVVDFYSSSAASSIYTANEFRLSYTIPKTARH